MSLIRTKSRIQLAATAGLLLGTSVAAYAYPTFQVNENAIASNNHTVTADQFNGSYLEEFVPDTTAGTFSAYTYFTLGSFSLNGSSVDNYLGTPASGGGYSVYALITTTGSYSGGTTINFSGASNTLSLIADPNKDTSNNFTVPPPASNAGFHLTGTSDDAALATGHGAGYGSLDTTQTGPNSGSFGITFNGFTLTDPLGQAYFMSPNPFYISMLTSGDFNTFNPDTPSTFTGTANVRFVPEPSSILMLGVGLLALGFTYKVRQRKDRA